MITLSINEASLAQTGKSAALLSPCHIQNSHRRAVFWACGFFRQARACGQAALFFRSLWIAAIDVLDLF
jgi:hypothetical protein